LSGAFAWEQTALSRPTPGIAFEFRFGYSSANVSAGTIGGTWTPTRFGPSARLAHTFDTRMIPEQSSTDRHILNWDGSIEDWMKPPASISPRAGIPRELTMLPNYDMNGEPTA